MRLRVICAGALVLATAPAALAPAQEGQSEVYEHVDLHFTAKGKAARTGFVWDVAQRAVAGADQPPPVRRARLRFPRGTRFDTAAIPRCTATDVELATSGPAACPAKTRLGRGEASVYI